MTTDPKTGMVVYKKKDPGFAEKFGNVVDELGTAINAPELHLSELLAGKNTKNTGRIKGFFDPSTSPIDSTKGSPLASIVSDLFAPPPAYAAAQEEGSPDISMVGNSGGQSQSMAPAQNSISQVASSKPTIVTKSTPQLSTSAKVSTSAKMPTTQPSTPAKPAMQAVPFVNMSPATLQSKAAPASVSKPSTPTQSNLATAAVNAIKSLFKR